MSRTGATLAAISLVAYTVLAFGYVTRTPIWQNPDEPAHFNYVAFVAQTGGLPVLEDGDWDSALLKRVQNGTLQPGDDIHTIRYESWQPPLFYLLAAPVFRLGPSDPGDVLTRLRIFDTAIGALTLGLAYVIGRTVFENSIRGAAVPMAMVGIPMFTAVSASLSADPLANLLAAAILLTLIVKARPVVIGVLLGLGLLTKLELAIFIPLVALALRRRPRSVAAALGIAAALTVPWLVHQVTSYGWTDPLAAARHAQVVADQPRFPGFSLDWLGQFASISFHSFWAQFGWMAIVAPDRLYWLWGFATMLAAVGLIKGPSWRNDPRFQLMAATALIAFIAYVAYNLDFVQFQSRYLFTAIVPIAALLVLGWSNLIPKPTWSSLLVTSALVAVNAYTLVRVLVPGFAPGA